MRVQGLPIHTLVRGRFVMRDRKLVEGTRGHGQSVRRVQMMPTPEPRHTDQTMAAVLGGAAPAPAATPAEGRS